MAQFAKLFHIENREVLILKKTGNSGEEIGVEISAFINDVGVITTTHSIYPGIRNGESFDKLGEPEAKRFLHWVNICFGVARTVQNSQDIKRDLARVPAN